MIIDYHPQAMSDLLDGAKYYESREKGLGHRFLDIIEEELKIIDRDPFIWQADEKDRRKYGVFGFPYNIIYRIQENFIFILAIAHTSKKPGFWEERDK